MMAEEVVVHERRRKPQPKWMPKTKTFILNALVLVATIGSYLLSTPELKEAIKDHALLILAVTNIANIIVRQATDQPAAWTRPPAEKHGEVGDD